MTFLTLTLDVTWDLMWTWPGDSMFLLPEIFNTQRYCCMHAPWMFGETYCIAFQGTHIRRSKYILWRSDGSCC